MNLSDPSERTARKFSSSSAPTNSTPALLDELEEEEELELLLELEDDEDELELLEELELLLDEAELLEDETDELLALEE